MISVSVRDDERLRQIADSFGLDLHARVAPPRFEGLEIPANGLVFVTGASGSGKSTFVRELMRSNERMRGLPSEAELERDSRPIATLFQMSAGSVIRWLAKFGLGEPRLLLLPFGCLSDGQKYRLRLALLLADRPEEIIVDEFLSVVDRESALLVAWQAQKLIRQAGVKRAVIASPHDDLIEALDPDFTLTMRFNGRYSMRQRDRDGQGEAFWKAKVTIGNREWEDFEDLARFHYVDEAHGGGALNADHMAALRRSLVEVRGVAYGSSLAAVAVFTSPHPGRFETIPILKRINERVVVRARTIVDPRFRGLGLTSLLLPSEANASRIVVSSSALGLFYPFQLRGGFAAVRHPSMERTDEHRELERHLELTTSPVEGTDVISVRPSSERLEALLRTAGRDRILELARKIFTAQSLSQVRFHAALARVEVTKKDEALLRAFFDALGERSSRIYPVQTVGEALYFPMQGFYREPDALERGEDR